MRWVIPLVMTSLVAAAVPALAEETDGYDFTCTLGLVTRVAVWNADVLGHGDCGAGSHAECDNGPTPHASCSGRSAAGATDANGHCGYDRVGADGTFFVVCWSDAGLPHAPPARPSGLPAYEAPFLCRAGEFVHVVVQSALVVAEADCGLARTSCQPQATTVGFAACSNTGPVPATETRTGTCRYWGSEPYYSFPFVCWTDADPAVGT